VRTEFPDPEDEPDESYNGDRNGEPAEDGIGCAVVLVCLICLGLLLAFVVIGDNLSRQLHTAGT
jgi:hypothetical protein